MSTADTEAKTESQNEINLRARLGPLKSRYREAPKEAEVGAWAITTGDMDTDDVHGEIDLGWSTGGAEPAEVYANGKPEEPDFDVQVSTGVHRAVGGDHNLPNP